MNTPLSFKNTHTIEVSIDSANFPVRCGTEFSDHASFFTLEQNRHRVHMEQVSAYDSLGDIKRAYHIALQSGTGMLESHDAIHDTTISRKQRLTATSNMLLLDFVARYVFPASQFTHAVIAGHTVLHCGNNVYHQYPHDGLSVTLTGPVCNATIRLDAWEAAGFDAYLYVRDEDDHWVVHVRLLPRFRTHCVVKLNTSWYNRALPEALQRVIPRSLIRKLQYLGERRRQWKLWEKALYALLPLSSYPLVSVPAESTVYLNSSCTFSRTDAASAQQ